MRDPKAPAPPIAWRRDSFTALAVATLRFAGCAATGDAGREAATQLQQSPGKAEDFMIVDCLLPGQIRRLGAQLTFLTARRAIKTSSRDCEIRGGEYVAFDRSNYATALKIWLPLAKEGDASAQTYVGEIFEKGLGVPPDHAAAAERDRRGGGGGGHPGGGAPRGPPARAGARSPEGPAPGAHLVPPRRGSRQPLLHHRARRDIGRSPAAQDRGGRAAAPARDEAGRARPPPAGAGKTRPKTRSAPG